MENFQTTVKIEQLKWIKNYLNNVDGKWRCTMEACIGEENISLLLLSNYDVKYLKQCSKFYKEILDNWSQIKYNHAFTDLSNQLIFYNKDFCVNRKMLYNKNILSAGIWQLKDVFINKDKMISCEDLKNRGLSGNDFFTAQYN